MSFAGTSGINCGGFRYIGEGIISVSLSLIDGVVEHGEFIASKSELESKEEENIN